MRTERRALSLAAALALVAGGAAAETSPWYIGLSQGWTYDSNVLRLAQGLETPEGYKRNDTISSTSLLAGLDQNIGRQRLSGSLNLRNNRFQGNPRFDNTSYGAQLTLDGSTVERITGSATVYASRSLQNFTNSVFIPTLQKDLETTRGVSGRLAVGLVTEYSLEVTGSRREVRNSLDDPGIRARDFDQDAGTVGLRWRPSAVGSLGLSLGAARGRYPRFTTDALGEPVADRFRRSDLQLSASYAPAGASSFEARLADGRTTYDLNQRRDFSGVTGSLAWNWQPTGKISMSTIVARDTGQDSYATLSALRQPSTADYARVSSGVRVLLDYAFSAKVAFNASGSTDHRQLVRTIDDPFIPQNASGSDTTNTLSLGARWVPTRSSQLGCDVSQIRRQGRGELTSSMSARTLGCYGQITLQ